jgi:peroxiredoxin
VCKTELDQLEAHWQEFKKQKVDVVVISIEDREAASATKEDFPHLVVVSDAERKLADAVEVIHRHSAPGGGDTAAPTTILVDGKGIVRWTFRPDRVLTRLSPSQLLAAVDREMPAD